MTTTRTPKAAGHRTRKEERVDDRMVRHRGVGMPLQFRTKLRYVYGGTLAVSGAIAAIAFGCNTPNQPSRSVATTETPGYYTKLAALYDLVYTVGSVITVRAVNVTIADGVQIVLTNDGNSTFSTNVNELSERPGAVKSMLGHYSGGSVVFNASHHWRPKPFIGVPADSPDNIVAAADPPNPYYWALAAISLGAGTGNLMYEVTVEYDVVFHELTSPY